MAMNNVMIVLEHSLALAEAGKIGYTGEIMTVEINGEEVELREPEQIHTYARWKTMGFQVRRGEKAIAKFKVWKHVSGKKKDDDGEEKTAEAGRGKMFLKQAAFFSAAQVEPIQGTA